MTHRLKPIELKDVTDSNAILANQIIKFLDPSACVPTRMLIVTHTVLGFFFHADTSLQLEKKRLIQLVTTFKPSDANKRRGRGEEEEEELPEKNKQKRKLEPARGAVVCTAHF